MGCEKPLLKGFSIYWMTKSSEARNANRRVNVN
jgi:hypothetical protein